MGVDMSGEEKNNTPSVVLANRIVKALTDQGLLLSGDVSKLSSKLSEGKITPEDWKLIAEKVIDQGSK
jgi:hypothetical protein